MSRGNGSKSNIKGRISGYETADFTIAGPSANTSSTVNSGSQKTPPIYKERRRIPLLKIIAITFGCLFVIFLIGKLSDSISSNSSRSTYQKPVALTPENASVKPTGFTQKQLDAQDARDKSIAELLKDGWLITNNEVPSNMYVTVGKKWESIRTNPSPIIKVTTSFKYEPKDQKYENSTLKIELQEITENSGIAVDSAVNNILKIYNPEINADSVNSSVQAAYNATVDSKPYEGSLTFDREHVYIKGNKSGRLITVSIEINTSIRSE